MTLFQPEPDDLPGINDLYENTVRPRLEKMESERPRLQKLGKWRFRLFLIAYFALLGLFLYGISYLPFDDFELILSLSVLAVVFWIFFFFWGGAWAYRALLDQRKEHKSSILHELASLLGYTHTPDGYERMFERFRRISMLQNYICAVSRDGISGEVRSLPFRLADVTLSLKKKSKIPSAEKPTLSLTLAEIRYPSTFHGTTIVVADKGAVMNFVASFSTGMERVRLEDPEFEKFFEVYSTDQTEARYLLPPAMMERCMEAKKRMDVLCLAFNRNDILVAFEGDQLINATVNIDIKNINAIRQTVRGFRRPAELVDILGIADPSATSDLPQIERAQ